MATSSFGNQRVLASLVNFSDSPMLKPFQLTQLQKNMSALNGFVREASYGQTWITPTSVGWITLPMTTAQWSDLALMANQSDQAAVASGFDLTQIDRFFYIFPHQNVWWHGETGGNRMWFNGDMSVRCMAHEFGHSMGLAHSHKKTCGSKAPLDYSCTISDDGDGYCAMGSLSAGNGVTTHYCAPQKAMLGWLGGVNWPNAPAASPKIVTIQESDGAEGPVTVQLGAYETNVDALPKALQVMRRRSWTAGSSMDNIDSFFIEARKAVGFDASRLINTNAASGVLIRQAYINGMGPSLLDMGSTTVSLNDAAIVPGQKFLDPMELIQIECVSADATGAQVRVTYGQPGDFTSTTGAALGTTIGAVVPGQTVSGTVPITASAPGANPAALTTGLRLYIDGVMKGYGATKLTCNWNTTSVAPGPHQIMAVAMDASGNKQTSYLFVMR
jgi:hypothetical protein